MKRYIIGNTHSCSSLVVIVCIRTYSHMYATQPKLDVDMMYEYLKGYYMILVLATTVSIVGILNKSLGKRQNLSIVICF